MTGYPFTNSPNRPIPLEMFVAGYQAASHGWLAAGRARPQRSFWNGWVCIEGCGQPLAVQLRNARVVGFSAGDGEWLESGRRVRISGQVAALRNDRFALHWTVQDLTAEGRQAIRQEYRFEGRFRGAEAEGRLHLRMIADFLNPTVELADRSGIARLYFGKLAQKASA